MKSIKIRIEPNNKQRTQFAKHAGAARHAYNWGLAVCKQALENKEKVPSGYDLQKRHVAEVKSAMTWYYEISKCAPAEALLDLDMAFKRFFKKKSKFPRFKKKGQRDSFHLSHCLPMQRNGKYLKLPKIGWVKCSEVLPECEIKAVTISRTADEWFMAFQVPFEPYITPKPHGVVGVDLGIRKLATLSDGTVYPQLRPYFQAKRKLKLAQRKMSKKFRKGQPQSKNYQKARMKVAKIHQRIANIRKNAIHNLTSYLAKNHSEIVIEDLGISQMVKDCKWAGLILDGGFYEFRRQLEYKCGFYGSKLTIADRNFPSSKTCSCCGIVKAGFPLSKVIFECEKCSLKIDRDLNAAINLKNIVAKNAINACEAGNPARAAA